MSDATLARDTAVPGVPTMNVDLYDPAILPDPWPIVAAIRDAGPIVWNERGFWMTARDRVARQVLARPGTLGQEGMISAFFGPEAFISIDEKRAHGALRDVWVAAFGRDGVGSLAPFVRATAHAMLDAIESSLRDGGTADLMAALCRPLPAYVIAHMMGVADDMIPKVVEWSDLMADATSGGFPIDYDNDPAWLAAERAKEELARFLEHQLRARRATPGDDLVSRIACSDIGAEVGERAMMVNLRQLLFAGNETTAKWLGHILAVLAERPDIRAAIAADRDLIRPANEEIMRWQGVTQVLPRGVNAEEVAVAGVPLLRGDEIVLLLGGANRDPDRYDRPDVLDIHRPPQPHLGFGFGLHSCLGAVLARMEAFEIVSAVLDRLPPHELAEPVIYGNFSLRGANALHVRACRPGSGSPRP